MAPRDPEAVEVRIKIGGPAGFGIKAAGQTLARLFTRAGYETFDLTEYPSLIKGGHNNYHLRISSEEIFSHVEPVDILVALDRDTVALHLDELTEGAAIIYDPNDFDIGEVAGVPDTACAVPAPLKEIVYEAGGIPIMRNVAALGAVLGHIGFPLDYLTRSIEQQFAHKAPEIAEQNVACASAGYEHARDHECAFPYDMQARDRDGERVLVDGNESAGLAALAAGVGLYCAYPMTPASSLLHFFAKHAEKHDIVVKHTEDEIAAMNMVVGGAFGGTRSMCATSGGGFSLMVEAFGLAGVSESAVVVGLFTRPGPATGMPTWTEQSDLRFAIHASQGEFPRVVLAPGDREDAFHLTWQAFNLADVLQTPVIILGDTYLSDNRQSVPPFDTSRVEIDRGEIITEGEVEEYARYRVTDSGVSPRAIPGLKGAEQVVNSYEHDEHGYGAQGEDTGVRIAQNEKRMRKMELARTLVPPPAYYGPDDADLSVLLFGSTKMPVREAAKWLEREGISINIMQVVTVWPFPAVEVSEFLGRARRTAIIEGNFTGQLQSLVREHCLTDVDHTLHRHDGRPFSPEQVRGFIKEVLG
ncbi:MAG: 2-oxoacid:acceptor oxidoreductase subunit alpha [Anaerosomatales bacterium]|nr:2-oxoacid:acceptor oxidoreductase subunit alpha [Anaerosomatales bacterium]MDT8433297.1 2-oxoacid:acceptor oxidoreductase subunit alpha [Anaerosomatales bacterium]